MDGFGGWLNECVQKLSVRELCHFVVICWGVWEARNKKVWEGVLSNPRHVARSSLAYLRDWVATRCPSFGEHWRENEMVDQWRASKPSMLKMNVDVAMYVDSNKMGMCWVLRDEGGRLVAVGGVGREGVCSPRETDALVVREALSWLKEHDYYGVQVETDALNKLLFNFIRRT